MKTRNTDRGRHEDEYLPRYSCSVVCVRCPGWNCSRGQKCNSEYDTKTYWDNNIRSLICDFNAISLNTYIFVKIFLGSGAGGVCLLLLSTLAYTLMNNWLNAHQICIEITEMKNKIKLTRVFWWAPISALSDHLSLSRLCASPFKWTE